jgi:pimeloyl-ACP methyl ester carboxylesterase
VKLLFAMYGTDTGMVIAYALAADHPDRVDRLVVSEAPIPGVSASPPLFLPPQLNARLWHLAFNQLATVNEQLVTGREDIFFGAEFDASAGASKLPGDAVSYYIDTLASGPDHLRGSFELDWTPVARATRHAEPDAWPARWSSSAVLPTPGSPRTTRARLSPAWTASASWLSAVRSLSRSVSLATLPGHPESHPV